MNATPSRLPRVLVLGTLDTKAEEFAYLKQELIAAGCDPLIMDLGILGTPGFPADITREEVLAKAGQPIAELQSGTQRGAAIDAAIAGATGIVHELRKQHAFEGVIAMGGGSGTTMGTTIMESLPFGVPKLVVTTLTSLHPHVHGTDVVVLRSLVDLVGLNPIIKVHIQQAAGAIAGMIRSASPIESATRSIVITCLGVTTPGVMALRERLLGRGKCVIVLHHETHAMKTLLDLDLVEAVVDFTPNEITRNVIFPPGEANDDRLHEVRDRGIPLLLVPGALDMTLHFVPFEKRPEELKERPYVVHSPDATLVRTSQEEQGRLGEILGGQLAASRGPVAAVLPFGGFSMWDAPGRAFEQPAARAAFRRGLRRNAPTLTVIETDAHINDEEFAEVVLTELMRLISKGDQ